MQEGSVSLLDGTIAHYLERPSEGPALDELIVIPGFTATAAFMQLLVQAMSPPPHWRIVIMELPFHGANKVPDFDGDFPDFEGVKSYMRSFVQCLGLGTSAPLSILGYSLGGGVCTRYLAAFPEQVSRAVLLAPAFFETMDDGFITNFQDDPRLVHGWETEEECLRFMTTNGGGCYEFPEVMIKMMVEERASYGPGYFTRFARKLDADPADQQALARITPQLGAASRPVMVITGQRDNCISEVKCAKIVAAIGAKFCSSHSLDDVGHVGGPKGSPHNLLTLAAPVAAKFLFGGASKL